MIIPQPHIEPIIEDYSGLSRWDKFLALLNSRSRYRLTDDWIVTIDDDVQLVVPKGFETDLASIPKLFWNLPGFSPEGPLLCGSILHDMGYQYQYLLSPYVASRSYPESSYRLREQFPILFGELIPIFVGRNQTFFDNLLAGITIEKTGAIFIAHAAAFALKLFGGSAWGKYRTTGPSAFNSNSLGLPGMTSRGPML